MALTSQILLLLSCTFYLGLLSSLVADENNPSEYIVQRVYAHLLIHDFQPALEEARAGISLYPTNKLMWISYLNVLAKGGEDKEVNDAWKRFLSLFPEEKNNHKLLENRAWGIIHKGFASTSPITRSSALFGAFLSQDARGVDLIEKALIDPNILIRGMAVQLASQLRDGQLQTKIINLLDSESNWRIRIQLIAAIGSMHLVEAKSKLLQILESPQRSIEEQAAAIQSLVEITETAQKDELERLIKNEHVGMRQLACEIIVHCELGECAELLLPLLNDYHAKVRAGALYALGIVDFPESAQSKINSVVDLYIPKLLEDHDLLVAITAAWFLTINKPEAGQLVFKKWINDKDEQTRSLAASALVATGKYGFPTTVQAFYQTVDPFVKMNLAHGLINQRIETTNACKCLADGLIDKNKRLMWKTVGPFRYLATSTLKYNDMIPQYPEVVNQLTRLEIINVLALLKSPTAQNAILAFLEQKTWGITGLASALLLTECDEASLQLIIPLLKHPSDKIRIQAALILAIWGREEAPIDVLQNSYDTADRDLKEKILEGLARIGATSSLPFFIIQLENPSQSLRIFAASALLQSLYH